MSPLLHRCVAAVTLATAVACGTSRLAAALATRPATDLAAILAAHPAADVLATFFDGAPRTVVQPPRAARADYLPLIADNVDYWKHFQDDRGAIIDPFERAERQYSTPAFALAAATLVARADREDLLAPATRAFTWSLWCLANKKSADGHADFYIPMLMHAHRILKSRAPAETLATWDAQLRGIVPETTYRVVTPANNWNLVNVAGEALRRKDGLVAPDKLAAQRAYVERCIGAQLEHAFTPTGLYMDGPSAPLAYDAFPRLWLEDVVADGAYDDGDHRAALERTLVLGGLSTLLLVSPSGEWPSGGRSAHHQWNEAQVSVIAEVNAARWQRAGRPDIAGAFKRAARLSRESMARWQRGSGEFYIVKNFADPGRRFGFMPYSFNSQYNLLAVAMLSIAHARADDSIPERPIPSEAGAYVFDVRDGMRHVAAAAGGYYAWIDTGANLAYGGTGLQRVHRAGVALSPLTDSAGPQPGTGPADERTRRAISPGVEWQDADGEWRSLAHYGYRSKTPSTTTTASAPPGIDAAELTIDERTATRVAFTIRYDLAGDGARTVIERYVISADGVEGSARVEGDGPLRVVFPALVNDGARDTSTTIDGQTLTINRLGAPTQFPVASKVATPKPGGTLAWQVTEPTGLSLARVGPQVVTHNGYVQAVAAELPAGVNEVRWRITLEPHEPK